MRGFSAIETTDLLYVTHRRETPQEYYSTSGTLCTVLVIALFLHILWDAGLHPLKQHTATQHFKGHANRVINTNLQLHSTRGSQTWTNSHQ